MFVAVHFDALAQTDRFSNRMETSCLPLLNAGIEPRVFEIESPADLMPPDELTEPPRIKLKKLELSGPSL